MYIPSNAGGHPAPRGGAPKGGRKIIGLLGRSNGRLRGYEFWGCARGVVFTKAKCDVFALVNSYKEIHHEGSGYKSQQ